MNGPYGDQSHVELTRNNPGGGAELGSVTVLLSQPHLQPYVWLPVTQDLILLVSETCKLYVEFSTFFFFFPKYKSIFLKNTLLESGRWFLLRFVSVVELGGKGGNFAQRGWKRHSTFLLVPDQIQKAFFNPKGAHDFPVVALLANGLLPAWVLLYWIYLFKEYRLWKKHRKLRTLYH